MRRNRIEQFLRDHKQEAIRIIFFSGLILLLFSIILIWLKKLNTDDLIISILINLGTEFSGGALVIYLVDVYTEKFSKTIDFEEISGFDALHDIKKELKNARQVFNTRIASEQWEDALKKNSIKSIGIYQEDLKDFPQKMANAVNKRVRVSELCSKTGKDIYEQFIKEKIKNDKRYLYKINVIEGDFPFLNYTIIESNNNEKKIWYGWLLLENERLEDQKIIVTKDDTFIEKILSFHKANENQPNLNRNKYQFRRGSLQELIQKVLVFYNEPFKELRIYGNYFGRITPLFENGTLDAKMIKLIVKYDNKSNRNEVGNSTTLSNLKIIEDYAKEKKSIVDVKTHINQPTQYYVLFDDKILIHGISTPSQIKSSLDVDVYPATLYTNESSTDATIINEYKIHFDDMFKIEQPINVFD